MKIVLIFALIVVCSGIALASLFYLQKSWVQKQTTGELTFSRLQWKYTSANGDSFYLVLMFDPEIGPGEIPCKFGVSSAPWRKLVMSLD